MRAAIQTIRAEWEGQAEQAFAARVSPFVEGDNYIDDVMYDLPSHSNLSRVIVDESTINNDEKPLLMVAEKGYSVGAG